MLHAVALEYAILTVRVIVIHIIQEIIANIVLKITMETRVPPVRLIIFPYSPLFNVLCRLWGLHNLQWQWNMQYFERRVYLCSWVPRPVLQSMHAKLVRTGLFYLYAGYLLFVFSFPESILDCEQNSTCSGLGSCDPMNGECLCYQYYFGPSCSIRTYDVWTVLVLTILPVCDATVNRSGNGLCNDSGLCECNYGYAEPSCDHCTTNQYGPSCQTCTFSSFPSYSISLPSEFIEFTK